MTTLIKASGVKFNNPNLPNVSPMVTDGLIAAWRPNSSTMGLLDLSGNGHTLTQVGNPILKSGSIIVDKNNGFITDVAEPFNHTILVVHKAIKNTTSNDPWTGFVIGCHYPDRGNSIWNSYYPDNDSVIINEQCYAKDIVNNNMNNRQWFTKEFKNASGFTETPFIMTAHVVDAVNNTMYKYSPGSIEDMSSYSSLTDNCRFDNRYLSDPVTGKPNMYALGYSYVGFGDGKSEILEVLIYDKALKQEQIMQQYLLSQDFLKKNRSIII